MGSSANRRRRRRKIIFYYTTRYRILSESYYPNLVRIWLVAATEIGGQDVEIISQSLLIYSLCEQDTVRVEYHLGRHYKLVRKKRFLTLSIGM